MEFYSTKHEKYCFSSQRNLLVFMSEDDDNKDLFSGHHLLSFEFLLRFFLLRRWFVVDGTARARENVLLLAQDQLDVAWRRLVWIDATMGTISTTADLRRSVDLNVLDDQVVNVEAFDIGVGFGVLQQIENHLGGLLRPSALRDFEHFRLRLAAHTAVEALEWNYFFLVDHVLQVTCRATKRHTSESVRRFTSILEVHA